MYPPAVVPLLLKVFQLILLAVVFYLFFGGPWVSGQVVIVAFFVPFSYALPFQCPLFVFLSVVSPLIGSLME